MAMMGESGDVSRRMQALIELLVKIGSEREPRRLLEFACDAARVIVGARYAAIGILEKDGQTLEYFVTSGVDQETIARIGPYPLGRGVLGKLLAERQPLRLRDLTADPASVGFPPVHPPMKSFLGVPLTSPSGLYGRLYLTEKIGAEEFDEQDEYVAVALAAQVAVAFENAHRLEEIQHHAASMQMEIAERKRSEEALRDSEKRFRALIENAPDGIALLGMDGKLQQITPTVQQILGYSIEESVGQDPAVLTHPDDLPGLLEVLGDLIQNPGKVARAFYRFQHKDGTWRWLDSTISNLIAEPSVQAIVFNYRDITEQKKAEAALQEREARLKAVVESVDAIIWSIDSDYRLTMFNNSYAQGIQSKLGIETRLGEIMPPVELPEDLHAEWKSRYDRALRGEAFHEEVFVESPVGERLFREYSFNPIVEPGGRVIGVTCFGLDITERKRAEQEIESLANFPRENNAPILRFGQDGRLLYANPASQNLLSFWGCEIGGNPPEEIGQMVNEAFATQQNPEMEVAYGGWVVSLVFVPITDKGYVNVYGRDITERKHAEAELKASEERFRLLFENNHNVMLLIEPETGAIRRANQVAAEYYGYPLSELSSMNITQINQLMPEEQHGERLRALREERNYFNFQHRLASGEIRHVEVRSTPIELDGTTLLFSIIYDITERKRAEEQIERQVHQLNALRMIDIAISSSFDLRVVLEVVLQQVVSQLGVDAGAVLLYDPETKMIEYAASRGFQSGLLNDVRLKMGEGYASQAALKLRTIHLSNLLQTGGKLAEALRSANETFVDYYGTPLIVKGQVKGVLEIYHRSPLNPDAGWLEFLEALAGQAAIAIDNAQLFESLQRSNAELEHRVAERTAQLHQSNAELEHANRAKDEFLANMSHELRTPLNSILGLSDSLLEERRGSLNEEQKKSLAIISSSGQHLLDLINDILDLSKIEAGMLDFLPQWISVEEFCRSCLAFIKAQATKKSITITYINDSPVPSVYADPRRLKQILVNLLSNAVKFTLENGHVTLQVSTDPERERIQFSVIDDGIGISPNDLTKLFQPFVQLDSSLNRQYQGTGLGLALIQKLVDLHGGSVDVESEIGRGSRFTVNLINHQNEALEHGNLQSPQSVIGSLPARADSVISEFTQPGGVILLAEDNQANILVIREYLESFGYEVVIAYDGLDAIKRAQEIHPDVILMDIQMPVMDGLDAIARLRTDERFAVTPIIALTALAMPGDRERCLLAGASEYLSKPVSMKILLQTIRRLTGR